VIGRVLLLCLALGGGVSGCNGAFHFGSGDDGGTTGDAGGAQPGSDAACTAATCPFATCNTDAGCTRSCPSNSTCIGTCGEACNALCASGSVCMVTVGENSSVVCQDGAQCNVVCGGEACNVMCATGAQCTVQCLGATKPVSVTGTLRCGL